MPSYGPGLPTCASAARRRQQNMQAKLPTGIPGGHASPLMHDSSPSAFSTEHTERCLHRVASSGFRKCQSADGRIISWLRDTHTSHMPSWSFLHAFIFPAATASASPAESDPAPPPPAPPEKLDILETTSKKTTAPRMSWTGPIACLAPPALPPRLLSERSLFGQGFPPRLRKASGAHTVFGEGGEGEKGGKVQRRRGEEEAGNLRVTWLRQSRLASSCPNALDE